MATVQAVVVVILHAGGIDLAVFAVGWTSGWLLLSRPRRLPRVEPDAPPRSTAAVVIPVRDETASLPRLLPSLSPQCRDGDEVVVVDDHSRDGSAELADSLGARVIHAPELPDGWLGKPHACWYGAGDTAAEVLVFLDADVHPAPDLLARIVAECDRHPDAVVSVQPWHETGSPAEQASMLCNVAALMGSAAFTIAGRRIRPRVAFGPVLAMHRRTYDAVGGHANAKVRSAHTEDIALARVVGTALLFTGAAGDTSFRMHPRGFGQLMRGWTRSIATGACRTPWWVALAMVAWVASLAGGFVAAPIVYPLSALQVWVLGRRAGSIHPLTAVLYPLATLVFLVIFVRSAIAFALGRDVTWKDRSVATRSPG